MINDIFLKNNFRCFSIFLLLFSINSEAQKIVIDERDKFLKERKIELSPFNLVSNDKVKMDIAFGTIGASPYLRLSGTGIGTNIVNVGDRVILLLDNDSTVTGKSTALQTYDVEGTVSTYKHSYNISLADLAKLRNHNVKAVRKYHAKEFDDIVIPNRNSELVKNYSSLLIEELKRENLFREQSEIIAQEKARRDSLEAAKKVVINTKPVNRAAAFPGGEQVWQNFLKRNLNPPAELKATERKMVLVQFLVRANGSVNELQIVQSAGPSFDKEVLRVLKRMPYWKPATENGQPVDTVVTQSITFFRDNSSAGL